MTPKKTQLPDDTTAITVYLKKTLLANVDEKCKPIPRNKVIKALLKGYAEGKFEIDWRE